jgi:copper homeostasis protein (lipoprotein)
MFRYLADAATIRLCATGARLPVAMEADYLRLERAYLKAQPAGRMGQPLLVNLEGLITNRPSAEPGRPPQRTLVVERFVGVHPGQGCPQPNTPPNASSAPASRPMAPLSLRGTLWKLQALQDSSGPTLFKPPGPTPELLLGVDQERVSGTGGCNRLIGGFRLAGEELSFSRLASTSAAVKHCSGTRPE